ncbi:MAG TPA: dTMP kinase [Candidatus Kapabacteria bacterium]|jgi:dTMP kinase|nr:dTMP kinase [Candidatus Kapabacteria bacterium]HOM03974.1 dTMP kinase [Candidatus Kapabacteria bacterium]HOQ48349.1 dTMP kinase [Candidatus Kapabacteria bacterium]HPP40608.1 dTMP kinase [Candidatus Kapabacteria bacterium]HPU23516.1 dTMP kinase [Candidatus Kapabacteria bacterium]
MLITFEGIDGCGKTTQIKLLKEYIESKGLSVVTMREPGGSDFSEQLRNILLSSRHRVGARSELMLFEAARANLVDTVIKPELERGKIVICDRFYDSTTAYQAFGRGLPLDFVQKLNLFATGGLTPNLTIYLSISLDESKRRTSRPEFDRIEKAGDEFFLKVIEGYNYIARQEPNRFVVVDASGSRQETARKVRKVFDKFFEGFPK